MASPPRFYGPDGILREQFYFTTTLSSRFFRGEMDADTADMQVSVRGGAFTSDPDLIFFEGTAFTIPNPSAFPDGLQLLAGQNRIEVKSILSNGQSTATSFSDVTLSLERDLGVLVTAPTGVYIERQDSTVKITVDGITTTGFQGFNFYASTEAGGGVVGYSRINIDLVSSGEVTERTSTLGELEVDTEVVTDVDGSHLADPQYLVYVGTQQDEDGDVLSTDFNQRLEIPETVTQVRTLVTVEEVQRTQRYSFVHDRAATYISSENPAVPNAAFNSLPASDPLYYVVTSVFFDGETEVESDLSFELAGSPLTVTTSVGVLPAVGRQQIVRDVAASINRSRPEIQIQPGSSLRDTFIDPFSTEASRIRFILDFLHIAGSFATLLQVDDPTFSGESIPVTQSAFKLGLKEAFFLTAVEDVQSLIDGAFDKLASNYGLTRKPGLRARGEVVFFTTSRPDTDLQFPIGTIVTASSTRYRTTSSATITSSGAGVFFNPTTGRYSVRAFIQAEDPGADGNVTSGQVNAVVNGPAGVSVTNPSSTFGGTDEESNRDLAVRALLALASVDSGTREGYENTAASVPQVLQVSVIDAGSPLMVRDYEPILGKHLNGSVDIWVRGSQSGRVTEGFVFAFEIAKSIQFEPVGDPQNLTFRAIDANLSEDNPIIEMLDRTDIGLGFRNTTKGYWFDLTDVRIDTYNVIQLSAEANDPVDISITDIIRGSYRYRTTDRYVPARQPITQVISLTGSVSGVIDPSLYALFRNGSPLAKGRSIEAGDYIKITQPVGETTIPSGEPVEVTDEFHVLLDGIEYLDNLGANPLTIAVFSTDRTIEYVGPYDPSVTGGVTPQWTILEGNATTPVGIQITGNTPPSGTELVAGDSVLIDYAYDENFVVEFDTNGLVRVVQSEIDNMRHLTADVLVKDAIAVGVDITATVVLFENYTVDEVDADLRTNLANMFNTQEIGLPLRQSDVVREIELTDGVSYVIVPLTKMVKADGSPVVREPLPTNTEADAFWVELWSTPAVDAYLLVTELESATTDGGGPTNEFRGVFQGETELSLQLQRPSVTGAPLKNSVGNCFIIGNTGLTIPGYSDDATLKAQEPFATADEIEARRVEISSNRVLVTLAPGDVPANYDYTVTYIVEGETGVKNIEVGPVEYLEEGTFNFTYDQDEDFATRQSNRARGR